MRVRAGRAGVVDGAVARKGEREGHQLEAIGAHARRAGEGHLLFREVQRSLQSRSGVTVDQVAVVCALAGPSILIDNDAGIGTSLRRGEVQRAAVEVYRADAARLG